MLTKLTIRNFKRFGEVDVEIDLGSPVVFIGPNNSGKTSAMQALALWDIGVKRWNEKRARKSAPDRRPGVTVNRRDLLAIPHPNAKLLWHQLRVRDIHLADGNQRTENVRIDLVVEGVGGGKNWTCGLEFDYANEESIYCRPLRTGDAEPSKRMLVPDEAGSVTVSFLSPMSGLATAETRLEQGAINVRVGEGRTAEVLRNLCYRVREENPDQWTSLVKRIEALFGVILEDPHYVVERGEITMGYRERGATLDLSSGGKGLQQTLLILAYMYANPGAVILLDEPDAHLEILRQRQIYSLISEVASERGNQIIAASHSEVLLNEAADRDLAVAFVGYPHRIDRKGSQVRKALSKISFAQYFQAEQTGWVLYLEGSTDLSILQALAKRLGNGDAIQVLERPFVHYVRNEPSRAESHFRGLKEALPDLKGVALCDRLGRNLPSTPALSHLVWERREIENYICSEATLLAWVRASTKADALSPFFTEEEYDRRSKAMHTAVAEVAGALKTLGKGSPWSEDVKASDEFLEPLFKKYFEILELPNLMAKKSFYGLAEHVPEDEIDPEIVEKLDRIVQVARSAEPVPEG